MTQIYPIGGGKGGVGKSFITANLGALLAKWGKKVVLIDLDLGGSNLHTLLGINHQKGGINRFLDKTVKNLGDTAVSTFIQNLSFIGSSLCSMEVANLLHAHKLKIINAIQKLSFDYILLDLGTGTNFNTLDFFLTSNQGIFICTPEPTAIENSFRFIKAVYLRKLKQIVKRQFFNSAVKKAIIPQNHEAMTSPDVIEIMLKHDPDREKFLRNSLSEFKFKFILNQFRKNLDVTMGDKIEDLCNRHFYSNFQFLGTVGYDVRIHDSVLSKKIFTHRYPYTPPAMDMKKIAEKIINNRPWDH
ncbi:MAG: AAA family ATPase [Deltaproteobacteria bacterium]|nr:AAA family ATPase [Deltaproteobacteria bacterium]MBW2640925.1 AAA family ATPase [Deltaproteobacteria bacterium]MBW2680034.1 AAA family ATPase [Deltaproteobacteria bacterium]